MKWKNIMKPKIINLDKNLLTQRGIYSINSRNIYRVNGKMRGR
ncbi:MAG: hypothetical protein ACMXYG_04045 [Candidatus Woesearchaeota archaeon]